MYLLHFNRPYRHARHYVGFTRDLEQRVAQHQSGQGSPLLRAVGEAGITFKVARVWRNVTVRFERRVHKMQKKLLCPYCVGPHSHRQGPPRLSDYREIEDPYPENLEHDGHWEYHPELREARQEHPGELPMLGEFWPELLSKDGLLTARLDPES